MALGLDMRSRSFLLDAEIRAAVQESRLGDLRMNDHNASRNSEKIDNTLDVFEYLLFCFITFGHLRRQPPAAGRKQSFKGVTD